MTKDNKQSRAGEEAVEWLRFKQSFDLLVYNVFDWVLDWELVGMAVDVGVEK